MLDYGFRSKCCNAPIRLGHKKVKKLPNKLKIWVCTKCLSRDVPIVPKEGGEVQGAKPPFSGED